MDQRTREVLEFDKVLEHIAGRAASSLGRDFVLALEPFEEAKAVEARYAPLREICNLLDRGESFPLGGLFDARPLLEHARIEGSALDEEEWPRIARFLQLCAELVRFRDDHRASMPAFAMMLADLEANEELQRKLARTLDKEGRIRDDATPELARARRSLRDGEQRLLRTVGRLVGELNDRGVLQENFSTMRNGRHVFPVRAGSRGRIRGIQHGSSASGETVYIEPLEIIESSNDLENLRDAERREVHRITLELTALLRPYLPVGMHNVELLAQLDGLYALGRTAADKNWNIPVVEEHGALRLYNAEHPLLNLRPGQSVPIAMLLDRGDRCIVLSGPNAGGKTTMMKTVGLLALLVKCGCPIPAFPDSSIPIFNDVLADIGDQQDLEEGVSTFTGHIRRIGELWRKSSHNCLVLMDELGTGTDPQEGGALAVSLLEGFVSRAGLTITTSHLNPVKVWAEDTPGARNASFSLSPDTHEPTFHLRLDIPGASEALEIARREGLPAELMDRARQLAGKRQLEMGELLRRIEGRERRLAEQLKEAEARAHTLAEQEEVVRARSDMLRNERHQLKEESLREKTHATQQIRERLERLIAELPGEDELKRRKEALIRAREEVLRQQELTNAERRRIAEAQVETGELTGGQRVFIRTLGQWGELVHIDEAAKKARLIVGQIEVTAKTGDLLDHDPAERRAEQIAKSRDIVQEAKRPGKKKKNKRIRDALRAADEYTGQTRRPRITVGGKASLPERPASMTIDLHGYRVEEALAELDRYIDRSILADFPYIKICHGTGTGRLYKAVHQYLKDHQAIKSYRFGTTDEGGGGITIAEL